MSDFTPGPWTFDPRWECVKAPDGELLLVSGVALPSGNHPKAREAAANARLIAAAPALLEACKSAIAFLSAVHGDRGAGLVLRQLRDAAGRAEGE
jgi:hypothetical protein